MYLNTSVAHRVTDVTAAQFSGLGNEVRVQFDDVAHYGFDDQTYAQTRLETDFGTVLIIYDKPCSAVQVEEYQDGELIDEHTYSPYGSTSRQWEDETADDLTDLLVEAARDAALTA